jgi:TPR repeat protein
MANVGRCYLAGRGVRKSRFTAVRWLRRASRAGYRPARALLRELVAQPVRDAVASAGLAGAGPRRLRF